MSAKTAKTVTPAQLQQARRACLHLDGMLRLARGLDLLGRGEALPNDPRDLDRPKAKKSCDGGM